MIQAHSCYKFIAKINLNGKSNPYFDNRQDYLELWKLEVLPGYQNRGYGRALVEFAKSFKMPIRTNPRMKSAEFWNKMNFKTVKYDMARDKGEKDYKALIDIMDRARKMVVSKEDGRMKKAAQET